MPSSNARTKRVRREAMNTADIPDSSPSRPAKRRRKATLPNDLTPEPESHVPHAPFKRPEDIPYGDDDLLARITPYFQMPEHDVQVSKDHANSVHEENNRDGVQAYAKLAGNNWTYYVKSLKNMIGRPPEELKNPQTPDANGQPSESDIDTGIAIDLGPMKMVSRLHAEINYEAQDWAITVYGRNGIRINNVILKKGERRTLTSGQIIEIAGVEMIFVAPHEGRLRVPESHLLRAQLLLPQNSTDVEDLGGNTTSSAPSSAQPSRNHNGTVSIAPAPPDYQRPGTPMSARSRVQYSTGKSPYAGGTMMMNADDVDLSLTSNEHIKPPYSYAQMITQAIIDTEEEKLNLSGIYKYIQKNYSYYRQQIGGGWQNSIRHNLSLNKSFHKVARATDEPGKGMKWCIKPEVRDDMAKICWKGGRGGHRGSSAPSSPANVTSRPNASAKKGSPKRSPNSKSPTSRSFPANIPQFTPDRSGQSSMQDLPGDGSPLPRHRKMNKGAFGLSDNAPGSPPVLTSSYMPEEGSSFVTPAPSRVHPRLMPPSTAQRPSQHMPTSSPAPFWKYADLGNTPMKGAGLDSSPIKGGMLAAPPSSSPPPAVARSPIRNGTPMKPVIPEVDEDEEEDKGFDLTKGFQSISSFHAPVSSAISLAPPPAAAAAISGA